MHISNFCSEPGCKGKPTVVLNLRPYCSACGLAVARLECGRPGHRETTPREINIGQLHRM